MLLLLAQAGFTLLIIAAVMVPGLALGALLGLRGALGQHLQQAACVVLGLGWATIASAAVVLPGLARQLYLPLLMLPALVWCVVQVRDRRRGANCETWRMRERSTLLVLGWALLVAAMTGMAGAAFRGDGAFHAAIVEKLVHLPSPTPGDLSLFSDRQPMSSVLVPAWHHVLAGAATISGLDHPGLVAVWSAAGAVAALLVIAAGGVGRVVLGSDAGAVALALVTPLVLLADWWGQPPALQLSLGYPGNVVLFVVVPVLFALLAHLAVTPLARGPRTRSLAVVVAAMLTIGALHVTYAYYVALVGAAMLIASALVDRAAAKRLLLPGVAAAATLVFVLLAQLPILSDHREFGRGSDGSSGDLVRGLWSEQMAGGSFAVDPAWVWMMGLPFATGLVLVLLAPLAARARLSVLLLVVVPALVLGAASRSGPVAELVSGLGSYTPMPRTHRVVPAAAALVVAIVLIGDRLAARSGVVGRRRVQLAAGAAAAMSLAAGTWVTTPSKMGRDHAAIDAPLLPGWAFDALLLALAAAVLVVVIHALRRSRAGVVDEAARAAARPLPAFAVAFVAVFVVLGTGTWLWNLVGTVQRDRPSRILRASGLEVSPLVGVEGAELVRRLKPGSTVLVDPELSIRVAALAPVYITTTNKLLISNPKRERDAARFTSWPPTEGPPGARRGYIARHGIDAILLPAPERMTQNIEVFVAEHPQWQCVAGARGVGAYCKTPCVALLDR